MTLNNFRVLVALCPLFLMPVYAISQDASKEKESSVLEIGPATERNIKNNTSDYGITVGIETTPIEHWLELEYGATLLNTGRRPY